jgi:phosphocarrier protein HPr
MIELAATIQNEMGIHCRPSATILSATRDYPGDITVTAPAGDTHLKSVLELISLGLVKGTGIAISVSGREEERMCRELVELFQTHFDFQPRDAEEQCGTP